MQTILVFWAWVQAHALAVWPALSLVLILVLRTRSPEAWVQLGEHQPRVQGLIRMLRAAGLDPVKLVAGFLQVVTGRAPERVKVIVEMTAHDRARAAYEAYGTFVGWKAVSGAAMPQWTELPERIRAAWMVGVGASIGERVPIDPSEYPASRAFPSQEVR